MRLKPEQIAHINIVNWFNHNYPHFIKDFHHFANERRCSIQQGSLLKRMGVQKGVSDFFLALPIPEKNSSGLWIELKVGKGKLSEEQEEFLLRKSERGYQAKVVWGEESAKEEISHYMKEFNSIKLEIKPKNLFNSKPIC